MSYTLRVLHIIPDLGLAGAERMAVNLICGLKRDGFVVEAVSLYDRKGTELELLLEENGITTWYLGKRPGFDPRMYIRLGRILNRFQPDVVHTHRYVLRYLYPLPAYISTDVKIHTVHNIAEKEVDIFGRWLHYIAFRTGVVPVAIAQTVYSSIERFYGCKGMPLITNGIPVERYNKPNVPRKTWRLTEGFDDEAVLFVSIGRLEPQKNYSLLLEAFADGPARTDPNTKLIIVGEGYLRQNLEEQTRSLGLSARVHFLGLRTDIPNILAAADIFVLSSDYEGNPLVVMEAMAAGKPVIATAVGGVPELVEPEKTGILVQSGDARALANAMNRCLLMDEIERKAMGEQGAMRAVETFDIRTMVASYQKLYQALWNKKKAHGRIG